jgi:hypothetical protein
MKGRPVTRHCTLPCQGEPIEHVPVRRNSKVRLDLAEKRGWDKAREQGADDIEYVHRETLTGNSRLAFLRGFKRVLGHVQ